MKTIVNVIYGILLSICVTIFSPILIWVAFYKFDKVARLLDYGRLGAFNETIRIQTSNENVLWEGKTEDTPKLIWNMRVYSYYVEDGLLIIKVYRNDRKIAKYQKSLNK